MDRRTFVSMVAAGNAGSLLQRAAYAQAAPKVRNVVLVHGLFADGSCWSEVIARLQSKGMQVTSVQNPLTTLKEGVGATQRALALQDGPTFGSTPDARVGSLEWLLSAHCGNRPYSRSMSA
jgi:hypothetical protein